VKNETETLERYVLPTDVKERLDRLRKLSERAEDGDADAKKELKQAVRESSLTVIARASDFGRRAQHTLIETAAAGDPLTEYALSGRLDAMREEIAGPNPTPLEVLLTERIVACWILVELLEALMSAQFIPGKHTKVSISFRMHMLKWQESANRRYLAAIRELARVRKLQSNTPGIQYNQQININTS
jgi:hypothetical protein